MKDVKSASYAGGISLKEENENIIFPNEYEASLKEADHV